MRYRVSEEIHKRLETVLRLIATGRYSTPALAKEIGVSIPTISRIVNALRERGYEIRTERISSGWRYYLTEPSVPHVDNRAMLRKEPSWLAEGVNDGRP